MVNDQIYFNNCFVANDIRKNGDSGFFELNVGERGKKNKVLAVQYKLEVNKFCDTEDNNLPYHNQLTYYDMVVADAIYTLENNGHTSFKTGQILRIMSGNNKQTITKEKRKAIEMSILKLSSTYFWINCTSHINAIYGAKRMGPETIYEGKFLDIVKMSEQNSIVNIRMPLYRYAAYVRQIIPVPIELLRHQKANQKLQDTDEVVLIKRYLLHRLEVMRYGGNKMINRTISYCRLSHASPSETGGRKEVGLMPEIGIQRSDYTPASYKNKKSKVHNQIIKILENWVDLGYLVANEVKPPYVIKHGYNKSIEGIVISGKIIDPKYFVQ